MCFCFWPVVIAYICVCVCMCVCFLCLTWIRCENKNKEAELLRNWHAAVLRWGVCSLPLLKDRMRAICTLLFLFFFSCLFVFGLSRRCERKLTAARKGPSFSTGELLTHSFFFFWSVALWDARDACASDNKGSPCVKRSFPQEGCGISVIMWCAVALVCELIRFFVRPSFSASFFFFLCFSFLLC